MQAAEFDDLLRRTRRRLLTMHYESGVGHIGGNLSWLDALLALFHQMMRRRPVRALEGPLGRGVLRHALDPRTARRRRPGAFHKDGTRLPGHPPSRGIADIAFATGSLGHGLSLAAGIALAEVPSAQAGQSSA